MGLQVKRRLAEQVVNFGQKKNIRVKEQFDLGLGC